MSFSFSAALVLVERAKFRSWNLAFTQSQAAVCVTMIAPQSPSLAPCRHAPLARPSGVLACVSLQLINFSACRLFTRAIILLLYSSTLLERELNEKGTVSSHALEKQRRGPAPRSRSPSPPPPPPPHPTPYLPASVYTCLFCLCRSSQRREAKPKPVSISSKPLRAAACDDDDLLHHQQHQEEEEQDPATANSSTTSAPPLHQEVGGPAGDGGGEGGGRGGGGGGSLPPRSPVKQPKACVPTLEDALDDVQVCVFVCVCVCVRCFDERKK